MFYPPSVERLLEELLTYPRPKFLGISYYFHYCVTSFMLYLNPSYFQEPTPSPMPSALCYGLVVAWFLSFLPSHRV